MITSEWQPALDRAHYPDGTIALGYYRAEKVDTDLEARRTPKKCLRTVVTKGGVVYHLAVPQARMFGGDGKPDGTSDGRGRAFITPDGHVYWAEEWAEITGIPVDEMPPWPQSFMRQKAVDARH